jgi:SAM-dependent methyltransferase
MNIYKLYIPILRHFRKKRMHALELSFKISPATRVLDVGGYWMNWTFISCKPKLTILNLLNEGRPEPGVGYVKGDGLSLPFPDQSFDLVYSNSVIEHVGNWEKQMQFASESRRCARSYYIQTPYRWFFFEPHLLTPFVHWFPAKLRKRLFWVSWRFLLARPTVNEVEDLSNISLLSEKQMRILFPDGEIWKEKFLGMTKSLIAVRVSDIVSIPRGR